MPVLRTEFLIADNARARWIRRCEPEGDYATVQELHAAPVAAHNPQGVVFESGGGRFNLEERRGAVEKHRYRFAETLADVINARAAKGEFERLCLVAPARTLAAIRRRLTPEAEGVVIPGLSKDLTKTPDHALGDWLRDLELN
jgi:protein required for attachment to host cells